MPDLSLKYIRLAERLIEVFDPNDPVIPGEGLYDLCEVCGLDGTTAIPLFEGRGNLARVPGSGDLHEESEFYMSNKLFSLVKGSKVTTNPQRWTKDEANRRAEEIGRQDESFLKNPSAVEWHERIGCSVGLVYKLPLFKENHQAKRLSARPKVERSIWDDEPSHTIDDQKLQDLIAESKVEIRADPSPLSSSGRQPYQKKSL